MDRQYLYDLAFQFKKDKIWKKLYDSELYAVRLDDGQIGYCCVLGRNGEVFALTLYIGDKGFDSFRHLIVSNGEEEEDEDMPLQDCIQCSLEGRDELSGQELEEVRAYAKEKGIALRGANAYPKFARFQPYCAPWLLKDEAEWRHIARALEITNRLSEVLRHRSKFELGLQSIFKFDESLPLLTEDGDGLRAERIPMPPKIAPVYPEPALPDDMTLARLKKLKRQGTLECDIVRTPDLVQNDPEEPPYLPAQLLLVDQASGMVFGTAISNGPMVDCDEFQNALVDMLAKSDACPVAIQVRNAQTRQLVKGLCASLNIRMTMVEELPELDDALDTLYDQLSDGKGDPSEFSDQIDEVIATLSALSDEELRHLPPFLRQQLLSLDEWGMLPEDLARRLR